MNKNKESNLDYYLESLGELNWVPVMLIVIGFIALLVSIAFILDALKSRKERHKKAEDLRRHFFNRWLEEHVTKARWQTTHQSIEAYEIYFHEVFMKILTRYRHEGKDTLPDPVFLSEKKERTRRMLINQKMVKITPAIQK